MNRLLCPSMMCANFAHLEEEIRQLEEAGIDMFHLDIMDGVFVPNFGMGLQDVEYISKRSSKPCDVHLMIIHPERYINKFSDMGVKVIYIHPESGTNNVRTLQMIRDKGIKAGLAINPETSFEAVKELLYLCDYVLIMTVNPGFAGQKYLDFVTVKIRTFLNHKDYYHGYKVVIDGACSPDKIKELSKIGAEGFILGTSALFGKKKSYKEMMEKLRRI
ncbi:ribulose-phosphate 3-epimerase [Eggerthia catenaformis]|nr:ribulose-phosphate 3-epimerase [Eggerthia catenaformis]